MNLWIAALSALAIVIAVLIAMGRFRGRNRLRTSHGAVAQSESAYAPSPKHDGVLEIDALFDAGELAALEPACALVFEQGQSELLVIGNEAQAKSLGTIVGTARERVVASGRNASNVASAGVAAQERFGYLVRIHPQDAAALRLGKFLQTRVADGYARGVVMGPDGKFLNLARLKSASKLSSAASGAAIISSLAMQAQLDRIEKALGELLDEVRSVAQRLDDDDLASRSSRDQLISEIYRVASAKGQMTRAQWEQLAPMAHEVYKLQAKSATEFDRSIEKARTMSSKAKDRRKVLKELEPELQRALRLLNADDRAAAQFQALRQWHMTCSSDAALAETILDTRAQIETRSNARRNSLEELEAIFSTADVSGRIQRLHVRHRRKIRSSGETLVGMVQRSRLSDLELQPSIRSGLPVSGAAIAADETPTDAREPQ